MCGRVTLTTSGGEELAGLLEAELDPEDAKLYRPRYNVAPTDPHWIALAVADRRRLVPARWGVPGAGAGGSLSINARAETVGRAPAFRQALKERRCLVPTDGFYEWTGPKKARRPIWFHARAGGLVVLAGVYEVVPGEAPRFTILTTRANDLVAAVHDRMPVVLPGDAARAWLATPDRALLEPAPVDLLVATEVSPRVNSVANDDPSLLEPPPPPPAGEPAQFSLF